MAHYRTLPQNAALEAELLDALDAFPDRLQEGYARLADKGQADAPGGAEWRRVMRRIIASLKGERSIEHALLTWISYRE